MRIHKRKVAMIGIAVVMIASLAGCGASEGSDKNNVTPGAESVAASGQAVSEAAAEEDTRVAELEQVPPPEEYFCKQDVGDFTVYIYSGDAKKVVENISPLDGMYEGEYYIDVYQGNERRDSSLYEIMGNRTNYFYNDFELGVTDYNKDGLYDFALGNRLSSNYYEYRFYSVDSEGKLRVLLDHKGNEMMITANNDGFSPIFKTNERTVYYTSYDGIAGEYRENNAVFSEETAFVNENVNPFLTETGQVVPVTEVKVTDKDPWGSDMPEILFVNEDRLILTCYKGVFVYDKKEHKMYRTLDRKAIGFADTQGDNYTEIYATANGDKVYLSNKNKGVLYVFDVDDNTLTKHEYVDNLADQIDEFKHFVYGKIADLTSTDSDDDMEVTYFKSDRAWYYNKAGAKFYTVINTEDAFECGNGRLTDLLFYEYGGKDVETDPDPAFNKKEDTYGYIFKDEYRASVMVTGLSGDRLTFRNAVPKEDIYVEKEGEEPDDSIIVGMIGVGPEMSVSLTSDTKYNIYNGKYGSDGLELLSRVTSKQFRRYVKKELKIRDHEMKDAPHYCEPTCFGLPFLIKVKDGKCQVVTECYEV